MGLTDWLQSLNVSNSDPPPMAENYTEGIPFSTPREMFDPTLTPPSSNIARDVGTIFGAAPSLWERAKAAVDLPIQAFGLPQEGLTRLATGNEYALPSDIPAVRQALGGMEGEEFGGVLANLALDPLNLLALPAFNTAIKAGLETQTIARRLLNLNDIRMYARNGALFTDQKDLQKVLSRAGHANAPIGLDDTSRMWTLDTTGLEPEVARQMKADMQAAIHGRETDLLVDGKPVHEGGFHVTEVAPYDAAANRRSYRNPATETLKAGAQKSADLGGLKGLLKLVQTWVGSPENVSQASKRIVDQMRDTRQARHLYHDEMFHSEHSQAYRVLGPGQLWTEPGGDLGRAMFYRVFRPDIAGRMEAADGDAFRAIEAFGEPEFERRALGLEKIMTDALQKVSGSEKLLRTADGSQRPLGQIAREVMASSDAPLPDWLMDAMSASKEVLPQNANLADPVRFYFQGISKRAFVDPMAGAVREMIGTFDAGRRTGGTIKYMPDVEAQMLDKLLQAFEGRPVFQDRGLTQWIVRNKDDIRQVAWGQELAARVAGGERVKAQGVRGAFGNLAESVIRGAEKGQPPLTKLSQQGTGLLYDSLIGGAIDTALKNLPQTLNTITEFGLPRVLNAMGKYFTPEWRQALKAQDIVKRTNTFTDRLIAGADETGMLTARAGGFTDETRGYEKFREYIHTPFQMTENFNRGVGFIAALDHYMSQGMQLGDAVRAATGKTRDLQFGYSLTDMSPYFAGDPIIRPIFQFMAYPLKQIELLGKMYENKTGDVFRNQLVKYLVNAGIVVKYGAHLGADMSNLFVNGLFDAAPSAPLYQALGEARDLAGDFFGRVSNGGGDPEMESPTMAWKGLGKFLRLITPTGRYTGKFLRQEIESGGKAFGPADPVQLLFSPDYTVRQKMADHPEMQWLWDTVGIKPDPGIDPLDRFARMVGVRTLRDERRQGFMDFLKQFSRRYREFQGRINDTDALGGDTAEVQRQAREYMEKTFGHKLERYGVPVNEMIDDLQPTLSPKEATKRAEELRMSNVERLRTRLPKTAKEYLVPPEE